MKVLIIVTLITAIAGAPSRLLSVPKIYNAVITSDQNLSPSRAYPVIQPVLHQTAVGYYPPLFYHQVRPQHQYQYQYNDPSGAILEKSEIVKLDTKTVEKKVPKENLPEETAPKEWKEEKKDKEEVPLSFYPNYQSLYYNPYAYVYDGFITPSTAVPSAYNLFTPETNQPLVSIASQQDRHPAEEISVELRKERNGEMKNEKQEETAVEGIMPSIDTKS